MILNEGSQPELKVYQNEGSQIGSSVVDNILQQYSKAVNVTNVSRAKRNRSKYDSDHEESIPG